MSDLVPSHPLRICQLSSDYFPNSGGIAAHVDGLTAALAAAGHSVTVVVPRSGRNPMRPRCKVEHRGAVRVIRTHAWIPPRAGAHTLQERQLRILKDVLSGEQFDIVHWHTPIGDPELARSVPARARVFTNHTSQFLEWTSGQCVMPEAYEAIRGAEFVLCPSSELADASVRAGALRERVAFISNGVDPQRFSPLIDGSETRRTLGIAASELVILCPRRLDKKNGVTYWLRAIPNVRLAVSSARRIRFVLLGDYIGVDEYSDRDNVIAAIKQLRLGSDLLWLGSVPSEEMPRHLAMGDIIVLPSLMEATSIAGLEGMASGKALVGTNVGGLSEIIEDGVSGILVEPRSPDALARAMAHLLLNPEVRQRVGQNARARVLADFSWDSIAAKTVAVYQNLLSSPDPV